MMIINNQPNIQRQVGLNKMKTGLSSSTCPSLYGIHNCFNMNNLGCCVYAYPCCWEEVIPRVYMIKDTAGTPEIQVLLKYRAAKRATTERSPYHIEFSPIS